MKSILKIAYRNVLQNKKRSALISLTLILSCILLLFSFTLGNGIHRQIISQYRNFLSGDVTVVWENVKDIDVTDPSRLHFSRFDIKKGHENLHTIKRLDSFLEQNTNQILEYFKTLKGEGVLDNGEYASFSIIVGLTEEEAGFLRDKKVLVLTAGKLPFDQKYGICISDDISKKSGIQIGDWITLDSDTASGYVNSLEYQVTGIYKSQSEFDGIYVYMSKPDFLELYDQEPQYFQTLKIYLKSPGRAGEFAQKLDTYLLQDSTVLRAESIHYSGDFYLRIANMLKKLFAVFMIFILLIIAAGIRSIVRMNLFERMKEFGTLRAMGFSRIKCFTVIYLEIFILSLVCFAMAFAITLILTFITGHTGIYVGKGAIAYILGGESIYPVFIFTDIILGLLIITGFSIFAPLKPGLKLCSQKITDLLAQNQKPILVISYILNIKRKRSCISYE